MQGDDRATAGAMPSRHTISVLENDVVQAGRPTTFTRKNSFSNALEKLTDKANSFGHRRRMTSATLSSTSSLISASIVQPHQSRLPTLSTLSTPSKIPRSNSFFGSLSSTDTPNIDEPSDLSIPNTGGVRRYRKVPEKFIQLPFFSRQHQLHLPQRPLSSRTKRESSIRIEHRGLMAPIHPASMPRSSTMSNINQQRSVMTSPSFMRPIDSSVSNRRQSTTSSHQRQPSNSQSRSSNAAFFKPPAPRLPRHSPNHPAVKSPTPNVCITQSASSSTICFPTRRDSLACQSSPPTRPIVPSAMMSTSTNKAGTTQQSSLPQSAHLSTATRIPNPVDSLLTPEYEDIDEDERDKRATYDEPHHQADEEDERETTMTEEKDEAESLCRVKQSGNHLDHPHRQTSDLQNRFHTVPREEDLENSKEHLQHTHQCASDPEELRFVHGAKPTAFWLGRHTSLSDHLRTESISSLPDSPALSPFTIPNSHTAGNLNNTQRNRRVLNHLSSLCATEEALASLRRFQAEYEDKYGVDGESRKVARKQWTAAVSASSMAEKDWRGEGGEGGEEVRDGKKGKGWLNAFKGRNRR